MAHRARSEKSPLLRNILHRAFRKGTKLDASIASVYTVYIVYARMENVRETCASDRYTGQILFLRERKRVREDGWNTFRTKVMHKSVYCLINMEIHRVRAVR